MLKPFLILIFKQKILIPITVGKYLKLFQNISIITAKLFIKTGKFWNIEKIFKSVF